MDTQVRTDPTACRDAGQWLRDAAEDREPGLSPEQALGGAPATEQQRFSVPRILGDEQ